MPVPRIAHSQRRRRHRACRSLLCIPYPQPMRWQRRRGSAPPEEPGIGCNSSPKKLGHFSAESDSAWCISALLSDVETQSAGLLGSLFEEAAQQFLAHALHHLTDIGVDLWGLYSTSNGNRNSPACRAGCGLADRRGAATEEVGSQFEGKGLIEGDESLSGDPKRWTIELNAIQIQLT